MKNVKISTILIGVGLFFFFFILLFPYSKLRGMIFSNIYKSTQVYVNAQSLSPALFGWPGVRLSKANIIVPLGGGYVNILADSATARVGLLQLLPPKPSVSMSLDKISSGGDVWVKGGQTANDVQGNFQIQKLILNPFYLEPLGGALQGEATVDGEFQYSLVDLPKTTGRAAVALSKFKIPSQNLQGIIIPAISLGDVKGKVQARNGAIDIGPFQIGSASTEIRGSIAGDVRLGHSWMDSFLNLVVQIQLSEPYRNDGKNATLVSFLKTFERTPGDYALKWGATFGEMTTNLAAAIPQKAN